MFELQKSVDIDSNSVIHWLALVPSLNPDQPQTKKKLKPKLRKAFKKYEKFFPVIGGERRGQK